MRPVRDRDDDDGVRYQPDDKSPIPLTATVGLQLAALLLVGAVVIPTIVFQSAGASDAVIAWAVFASLALCGLTTMVQASPRFAAGYVIVTVGRSAAIAVCIAAVSKGGPALLALLVGVTAALQMLLAVRLSLFRRILTPAIAGTVIMLIPVSVMPVVLDNLERVPEGVSSAAGGLAAFVTVLVMAVVTLKGSSTMRLWAPIIGVGSGAACAAPLGSLRAGPRCRSGMDRASARRTANPESRLRTGFLGVAARLSDRHADWNRPERERQRRRPACILAPVAGSGLPIGPEHCRR